MQTEKRLTDYFDHIRIINIASRQDRRREVVQQLEKVGLEIGVDNVEFFDAVKPDAAAGFPNIGARGCFQSHLELLKEAAASQRQRVLILEDDANFIDGFATELPQILETLQHWHWDISYLGHAFVENSEKPAGFSYCSESIMTSHAYAVNGRALHELIAYLEAVLSREPGHLRGGPMHYDGALSMFRAQNPHIKTLVLTPPVVYQRPSRTDVHDLAFYDRLPGLRELANWARNCKSRLMVK